MLRFLTAGESHGQALVAILEGMPAGLAIDFEAMTNELRRRQTGYGRGRRMAIESDRAQVLSGVRGGLTTGGPIALLIPNKDWQNWQRTMAVEAEPPAESSGVDRPLVTRPRPGHADLAGVVKYGHDDIRNVLERASARETAARVAVGAIARQLLRQVGTDIVSHVVSIGSASLADPLAVTFEHVLAIGGESPLRCVDAEVEGRMIAEIDRAKKDGDSLGGVVEVIARGVPAGLGSYVQWDRRLDGRIAQALMSIHAVKAVAIGEGFAGGETRGSAFHDEILWSPSSGLERPTNHAGGLEGGVTNGEEIRALAIVKPIPTLLVALRSVDLVTKEPQKASVERSDTCVVPAAGVVAEAMLCLVLADALLEKTGGDSLEEVLAHLEATRAQQRRLAGPR